MVSKASKVRAIGRQRQALELTLEALATGPEHAALAEHCRALADHIDLEAAGGVCPECMRSAFDERIWREYRLTLGRLFKEVGNVDGQATIDLVEELRRT